MDNINEYESKITPEHVLEQAKTCPIITNVVSLHHKTVHNELESLYSHTNSGTRSDREVLFVPASETNKISNKATWGDNKIDVVANRSRYKKTNDAIAPR